ncbi:MAG: hypothetical protein J6B28_09010 [Eubacterium sp.]|nr:hypothetical protein [Eubacterium sp.]
MAIFFGSNRAYKDTIGKKSYSREDGRRLWLYRLFLMVLLVAVLAVAVSYVIYVMKARSGENLQNGVVLAQTQEIRWDGELI